MIQKNKRLTKFLARASLVTVLLLSAYIASSNSIPLPSTKMSNDKYATGYIVKKDNKQVGVLLGSFHLQLNFSEQAQFKKYFDQLVGEDSKVYTETPAEMLPWGGVEYALLQSLSEKELTTIGFEPAWAQRAWMNNTIIFGNELRQYPMSFSFIQNHPIIAYYANQSANTLCGAYNWVYNKISGGKHSEFRQQLNSAILTQKPEELYADYQAGQMIAPCDYINVVFYMNQRNELYASTLMNQEKPWVAVIGAFHLNGDNSVTATLERKCACI